MTPVTMQQRPSVREALRIANGARPGVERANAVAARVAVAVTLLVIVALTLGAQ